MKQPIWIWWFLVNLIVFANGKHECGVLRKTSDKIVGGRDVGFVKYPWYAGLFQKINQKSIICGATLISSKYVLSAAHCFKPWFNSVAAGKIKFEDIYVVKLGVNNICIPEPSQEIYTTTKVYVHEKYATEQPYFDIALLELENDATNFMPICLPIQRYESNNRSQEPGIIIGFGKEASNAWKLPCTLKQAEVPIQQDSTCRDMLTSMKVDGTKLQGAFCAGYLDGKIDTCQGDSGGPLQIENIDATFYILGITSFGFGCAQKNVLGLYTDVSHYLDWIYDRMGKTRVDGHASIIEIGNDITTATTPQLDDDNQDIAPRATTRKPKTRFQRKHHRSFWLRLLNDY